VRCSGDRWSRHPRLHFAVTAHSESRRDRQSGSQEFTKEAGDCSGFRGSWLPVFHAARVSLRISCNRCVSWAQLPVLLEPARSADNLIIQKWLRRSAGNAACSSLCAFSHFRFFFDFFSHPPWCRSHQPRICRTRHGCCVFPPSTASKSSSVTQANFTPSPGMAVSLAV
jgi:hypothetical protein